MTIDAQIIFKDRQDARVVPPTSTARGRRPLGLRPVGDDSGDAPAGTDTGPPRRAPADDRPAFMSDIDVIGAVAGQVLGEEVTALEKNLGGKLAELRNEVRDLKEALVEARCEVRELKLIQESLRISTRGESGRDGARGVPGRDGQQGPIGPQGPTGKQGRPGPRIASWVTHSATYEIQPLYDDGTKGPALAMMPLFQAYNTAVEADDE